MQSSNDIAQPLISLSDADQTLYDKKERRMSAVSAASIVSLEKKVEYKGEPRRWLVLLVVAMG